MEKSLKEIQNNLHKKFSLPEACALNPLSLAYIGDSIYSHAIRKYLLGLGHQNVNLMTKKSTVYVRASAQAKAIHALMPELTPEEIRMVKRGRNTQSQVPKNATPCDYRYATGFETLLGYLSLSDNEKRLEELILKSIAIINALESKN